ncbi:hypothetical protein ACIOHE_31375 [Streptomyces sp. NPDC087851]|uniref:hypothetical protein n=1 Tax=Streptomyces sp. NPDC087851 TaxID=3365810 RepID=UPI00381AC055
MTARETPAPAAAPTTHDRRMYALMNRGETRPFHATAARRRLVVGAHVALTALMVGSWGVAQAMDLTWPLFVMIGLLLPWCLATGVLNGATRGLLELRGRMLDERQRAERDLIRARAHGVTLRLLLGGAFVFIVLHALGDRDVTVSLSYALVVALAVHWLVPLWLAGLQARDEPADD